MFPNEGYEVKLLDVRRTVVGLGKLVKFVDSF